MDEKEFYNNTENESEVPQQAQGEDKEQNDDFIIGQGFTVSEYEPIVQFEADKSGKKKKSRGTLKNIIWVFCIVAVSIGIAFGAIYVAADYLGIGFGRGVECQMNIEMGSSTKAIAEELNESGAVKIPILFRIYSRLKGYDSQYKYGLYTFSNDLGYGEIATMLITEGAKAESIKVTIPEGTGIYDYTKNVNGENVTVKGIGAILEEKGVCTKEDFFTALKTVGEELNSNLLKDAQSEKTYHKLEGYLFPDTYEFFAYDSKECAELVVKRMFSQCEKQITDAMYKRAEDMGYTINEVITMASIIQMEAGQAGSALKDVAAVFYNRLDSADFQTLGSSPTCYYGRAFKNDDGRYDTYKIKDLPPGPLCSPGIEAIKAALYPSESEYYYFVTDSKGKFYFHKTMAEQNKTIAKLRNEGNWIYEYFD